MLFAILVGCSDAKTEEDVNERISVAENQLEKKLGEAYQDMELPGKPEDAEQAHYLYASDSTEIMGKTFSVSIIYFGNRENSEDLLTEMPTDCVSYTAALENDTEYVLSLRDAISEIYGTPIEVEGFNNLATAAEGGLSAMTENDVFRCAWEEEGFEIVLSVSGSETISLEVQVPGIAEKE